MQSLIRFSIINLFLFMAFFPKAGRLLPYRMVPCPASGAGHLRNARANHPRSWINAILPLLLASAMLSFTGVLALQSASAQAHVLQSNAFEVTTTADNGPGSLRAIIEQTNSNGIMGDSITFNIPGDGPHRIELATPLPPITLRVFIDATTQPGYSDRVPEVIIDGGGLEPGENGLDFSNPAVGGMLNTVSGLSIVGFTPDGDQGGAAIRLVSDFNQLTNNYIGIEPDGTPNANGYGVIVENSSSNWIGITTSNGNVISNNVVGVAIHGADASENQVRGNLIGTDAAGTEAAGNNTNIKVMGSSGNDIGGPAINHRNIISGAISTSGTTHGWGVQIMGSDEADAAGNIIRNNYIGTNINGTAAIPNGNDGVILESGVTETMIGGQAGEGNLISGNRGGIMIIEGSSGNQVMNNRIGTDHEGLSRIGNSQFGVRVDGTGNTIHNNQISGNGFGINVRGMSATDNVITGNLIGTDATGLNPVFNLRGIQVTSTGNVIGSSDPGGGNVISGNMQAGLVITNAGEIHSDDNIVQGNLIGVGLDGQTKLPNGRFGVEIQGGSGNLVGGSSPEEGNTIAWNQWAGIAVHSQTTPVAIENTLRHNRIFGNNGPGIDIGNDGFTDNSEFAPGDGPNLRMKYPEIVEFETAGQQITLGYLHPTGPDSAAYPLTIDFYIPDELGQGMQHVWTDSWEAADFPGPRQISFSISSTEHPDYDGRALTATATDSQGNTSEFTPIPSALPISDRFEVAADFPEIYLHMQVLNDRDIILANMTHYAVTSDGGQNWDVRERPVVQGVNFAIRGIYFQNANTGWLLGSPGVLLKTTDGGETWSHQQIENVNWINYLIMDDQGNGWFMSTNGLIFKTGNGGEDWEQAPASKDAFYVSVHSMDVSTSWLLMQTVIDQQLRYLVHKTNDAWQTGSDVMLPAGITPQTIFFTDAERGWITGEHGLLLTTTDGGNTWTPDEQPFTSSNLSAIYFENDQDGWIGGRSHELFSTEDSGMTWALDYTGEMPGGSVVAIQPTGTGNIVALINGRNSTSLVRLKRDDPTSTVEERLVPSAFRLGQNYPNPFNPSTQITFEIPASGEVRVDVFSIDGRRVATLLEQYMPAGSHSVSFDASGISSGVYLYRLQTGDQVAVRKMMLIR